MFLITNYFRLTSQSLLVVWCNNRFNIQEFTFSHTLFVFFVFILEQIATCALYNENWLVFVTEIKCLLRGTNRVFNWSSLLFVCKGLRYSYFQPLIVCYYLFKTYTFAVHIVNINLVNDLSKMLLVSIIYFLNVFVCSHFNALIYVTFFYT